MYRLWISEMRRKVNSTIFFTNTKKFWLNSICIGKLNKVNFLTKVLMLTRLTLAYFYIWTCITIRDYCNSDWLIKGHELKMKWLRKIWLLFQFNFYRLMLLIDSIMLILIHHILYFNIKYCVQFIFYFFKFVFKIYYFFFYRRKAFFSFLELNSLEMYNNFTQFCLKRKKNGKY